MQPNERENESHKFLREHNLANHIAWNMIRDGDLTLEAMFDEEHAQLIDHYLRQFQEDAADSLSIAGDKHSNPAERAEFLINGIEATARWTNTRAALYELRGAMERLHRAQAMSGTQPA